MPIDFGMTKFFSQDLAGNVGYGIATEIAAVSSELHTDLQRLAAVRKARGLPTFDEQEAADKVEFRQMIVEGVEFDPDVVAWALED
jgi:hypothetical protein